MLIDIFSSFDPYTCKIYSSIYPTIFWGLSFIILVIIQPSLWPTYSKINKSIHNPMFIIRNQVIRTQIKHIGGATLIITSLFLILIILNLLGLLPYVFRITRHLILTLTLGLPLWIRLILRAICYRPKKTVAHLLPRGAPEWLNPFLVITETLRILVRFITLSFRLAANIRAGHILLGLIGIASSCSIFLSFPTFLILILIQLGYTIFEIGICLIQAYIFCLLLTLYSDDHPV